MAPITINAFLGASLAFDDTLLPAGVGVVSLNQRPGYGDLRPWNLPTGTLATVPTSPQRLTIHRMGQDVASDSEYWLSWSGVVHAVTGFDVTDTTERTYYTGDGIPKWTNNVIGLSGGAPYPQASGALGVPAPTTQLVATVNTAGTTGSDIGYSWVYTFVNSLGWESAPSPVSATTLAKIGTTFNLTGFDTAPSGAYNITTIRLYRFVAGESTAGNFFFVREWAIGSTPGNPQDDARAAGSDPIATTGWRPCPGIPNGGALNLTEPTARGLIRMWNGMLGVGSGKSFRICEPYIPYAWPLDYEIPLPDTFVAAGVWSQRVLILTNGDAVVAAGSSPDAMDDEPAKINRPCASARSVVEFNEGEAYKGVAWASQDGLCWYGDGGFRVLTKDILTREQWQALAPSTMIASRFDGLYVCFYNDGALKGFVIDPQNPQGIYYLSTGYNAVFRDPLTDRLYVLDGGNIRRWNGGSAMTATFRSKLIQTPSHMSVGAIEIIAKGYPVTIRLWAGGTLRLTQTINADQIIRPPGGWESDELQVEVTSAARVIAVRLAQSVADLREP